MFGSSFPLFKFMGIQVVSNWTIFILMIFGSMQFSHVGNGGALAGALAIVLTVFIHEMAHALAARNCGAQVGEIHVGIVGLATYSGRMSSGQRAWVAFAGPLSNFVTAAMAFALLDIQVGTSQAMNMTSVATGFSGSLLVALIMYGVFLGVFNMLPAVPMDGGWVLQHLLELKLQESRARLITLKVTIVTSALIIALGFVGFGLFAMIIGGYILFKAWLELKARTVFGDGGSFMEGLRNQMNDMQQKRRESKERQAEDKKRESEIETRAKIDQLLVKISKEGMASLSKEERDYLNENSKRY